MKKTILNLLFACASVVFIIFIFEVLLAIGSYYFYPRLSVSDNTLGWKYKHTPQKVTRRRAADVVYDVYINQDGFRDDEFRRSEDCYRIMVLGDSFVFGIETNQEEILTSLLEKKVEEASDREEIDVMNFGMPGFSPAQELLCLKKYAGTFPPDVVILLLHEGNDFKDNFAVLTGGRYTPHMTEKGGEFVLDNNPSRMQKISTFLRDNSFIYYFFSRSKLKKLQRVFYRPQEVGNEDMVEAMCEILGEVKDYTRTLGVPLLVYYINYVDKDLNSRRREALRSYCEEEDIFFENIPYRREERHHGEWHWNKKGHNSVAEMIFRELEERKLF